MRRELMEEVDVEVTKETAVGVINDDSTDVGYVHLGIVHIVQVSDETVASGRIGMVGAEFVPINEAGKNLEAYESWSRFCLENLDGLLAKAAAVVPDSKVA
jgi:predicted NUDIX family phosphoesterase